MTRRGLLLVCLCGRAECQRSRHVESKLVMIHQMTAAFKDIFSVTESLLLGVTHRLYHLSAVSLCGQRCYHMGMWEVEDPNCSR